MAEQGYAFARIRPKVDRDPAANVIGITYVIEEGPRIYIERINVNGNTRTRDYVIRREFRLVEGDAYNPLLVDRAKKRLQALGFFKTVEIRRNAGSSPIASFSMSISSSSRRANCPSAPATRRLKASSVTSASPSATCWGAASSCA